MLEVLDFMMRSFKRRRIKGREPAPDSLQTEKCLLAWIYWRHKPEFQMQILFFPCKHLAMKANSPPGCSEQRMEGSWRTGSLSNPPWRTRRHLRPRTNQLEGDGQMVLKDVCARASGEASHGGTLLSRGICEIPRRRPRTFQREPPRIRRPDVRRVQEGWIFHIHYQTE